MPSTRLTTAITIRQAAMMIDPYPLTPAQKAALKWLVEKAKSGEIDGEEFYFTWEWSDTGSLNPTLPRQLNFVIFGYEGEDIPAIKRSTIDQLELKEYLRVTELDNDRYRGYISQLAYEAVENWTHRNESETIMDVGQAKIFLSHISEEAPLALALKEWIESTFTDKFDVFVSSDSQDILPGDQWLDSINTALSGAKVLLILCSRQSLSRPWINFEAGCGWIKNVPILPICHSGLTKDTLPEPLSRFQALDLDADDFGKRLIKGLAPRVGLSRTPRIDYDRMAEELKAALDSIKYDRPNLQSPGDGKDPSSHAFEILLLKNLAEYGDRGVESKNFAQDLDETNAKVKYVLERMRQEDLVSITNTNPPKYLVTQQGLEVLVQGGHV